MQVQSGSSLKFQEETVSETLRRPGAVHPEGTDPECFLDLRCLNNGTT